MATAFSPRFFLPTAPTDPYMDLTPEELAQERISRAYRSASERGPVAAMLAAAQAMKEHYPAQSDAAPEPATVSGGSVIGLMPEQTTDLLDRVQRQNEIDRKMYEARQSDLRQQAQAREGYIFRARDAEANRQQRAAIEDARIKQKQAAEAEKMKRGTITPLPGNPGFGLQRRINPETGQDEASIIRLQGADLIPKEEKQYAPHFDKVLGPDGKPQIRALDPSQTYTPAPPAPSPVSLENAITTRMKFYAGYGRKDASGKIVPISADEAKQLAQAEFNDTAPADQVVDAGHLFPLPKGAAEKNISDLIRKDFTVNLRTSKASDRFNTLSNKDHEDFAYETTATAYGMSVDEVKAALKGKSDSSSARSMGGMPIVQGSQPPAVPAASSGLTPDGKGGLSWNP